jgi:hypothetical protein
MGRVAPFERYSGEEDQALLEKGHNSSLWRSFFTAHTVPDDECSEGALTFQQLKSISQG